MIHPGLDQAVYHVWEDVGSFQRMLSKLASWVFKCSVYVLAFWHAYLYLLGGGGVIIDALTWPFGLYLSVT